MIKTIIFDLGGVYFTDGTKEAIQKISSQYNIPAEKVQDVLRGELGTKYRIGAVTAEEFWNQAKAYWHIEALNYDLALAWFLGYVPIVGTVEIIKALKVFGYELVFLSDNVQERVEYLEQKYRFLGYFRDGVFSHVAKTRKPDPRIYTLILEKCSNPSSQCVYIDDKEELLEPAKALGMHTIHFKNPEQLRESLTTLGITL